MRSIVLIILSLLIGTFFIFIGSLKVTQVIHREMHREIRRNFIQYVKVFPFNEKMIGFKITPKIYRLFIGYLEIVCGSLLVLLPNTWKLKNVSTFVLLASNLLSLYTHLKLNDKFERLAPSIVFSLMLVCRLIVYLQVQRRIDNQDKQKEREERRRLLESGQLSLDQLSMSTTDDENESIEDIDDEELEKYIKISRRLQKNKKRRLINREDDLQILGEMGTQTLDDDSVNLGSSEMDSSSKLGMLIEENSLDSHHKKLLIIDGQDENKKSI